MMKKKEITLAVVITLFLAACSKQSEPNQELAEFIDLDRFMGKWYVQGYTPTLIDRGAWNPIEIYERKSDGRIQTTYQFNKGDANGKLKTYKPVGKVHNEKTNAEWRMRFFGVVNAAYYIVYVDPEYRYTIIGHPNKRFAWVMSRGPDIDESAYEKLVDELKDRDYDLSGFERARR